MRPPACPGRPGTQRGPDRRSGAAAATLPDVSSCPSQPPALRTAVPGPRSVALARRLAAVESRNVTCTEPAPPIFWERASGANVWDVDGNRFVDLGAGFGVANAGHAHPRIVEAVRAQAEPRHKPVRYRYRYGHGKACDDRPTHQ